MSKDRVYDDQLIAMNTYAAPVLLFYVLFAQDAISLSSALQGKSHSPVTPTVISANLCTDQLLLLFDNLRVNIGVTPLAADHDDNYLSAKVRPGQIIKPDLDRLLEKQPEAVLVSPFTDKYLIHGLHTFGIKVVTIPTAHDFKQINQNIMTVAKLLRSPEQGKVIVQGINTTLLTIKQQVKNSPEYSALIYAPNGFTHGSHTIYDAILQAAGLKNLAAKLGIVGSGYLSIEDVLWYQPDYLIMENAAPNDYSMAQALLSHPALKKLEKRIQVLHVDANLFTCAGPNSVKALKRIVEQL